MKVNHSDWILSTHVSLTATWLGYILPMNVNDWQTEPVSYLLQLMNVWLTTSFLNWSYRISSRNCGTGRRSDAEQDDIAVSSFWFFSRSPMKSALTKCVSHEMEDVAVRMSNSTLVYTGFESTGTHWFMLNLVEAWVVNFALSFVLPVFYNLL